MRALTVLTLCLALAACGGGQDGEPALRARLGPPLAQLGAAMDQAERMAGSARYRVERGAPMRDALGLVRGALDEVRASAADLAHAAQDVGDPMAAAIARQSVELGLQAADDADVEIAALAPLVEVDIVMAEVVAAWSQAVDAALADRAAALRPAVDAAPVAPPACAALKDNRLRWVALIAERTRALAEAAPDDERRQAFQADPFGEDRRAADAADRECWDEHGALPRARRDLRVLAERFDELTRPGRDNGRSPRDDG